MNMQSKSLLLVAPERFEWISELLPPLGIHDVLVQTRTGAISIGSELPLYRGTSRATLSIEYPYMTGYENVGMVLECGSHVRTVSPGDCIVSSYGYRTYAVIPEATVIPIPHGISDALAILSILTCDAAKGVRTLMPMPEEPVLITGAGAMGLLTLFVLRAYGCMYIDVVEPISRRHQLASLLGARNVYFPRDIPLAKESYPVGFECSSRNAAFALLQNQMQKNGHICITADGNIEPFVLTPSFHERELRIFGSSDGWDYQKHATWYFHQIQQSVPHLEQLFEEECGQEDIASMFERLAGKNSSLPVKVLIHYE